LIFSQVDVFSQKVDFFLVDVLKIDVLEVVQMGRPVANQIGLITLTVITLSGFDPLKNVTLYLKNFIHLLSKDLRKVGNVIFMVVL
jgi:hypothetical protein